MDLSNTVTASENLAQGVICLTALFQPQKLKSVRWENNMIMILEIGGGDLQAGE